MSSAHLGTPPVETLRSPRRGRRSSPQRRSDTRAALLFISPWVIGFLVFTLWPVIYSAYLSFTEYDVINPPSYVGFDNYTQMFADEKVRLALKNTFIFTVLSVPAKIIVSLLLALLLKQAARAT